MFGDDGEEDDLVDEAASEEPLVVVLEKTEVVACTVANVALIGLLLVSLPMRSVQKQALHFLSHLEQVDFDHFRRDKLSWEIFQFLLPKN